MKHLTLILTIFAASLSFANDLTLKEINNLIATLDQTKLMDTLIGEISLDLETQTITKFSKAYDHDGSSGLECKATTIDLTDAKCAIIVRYGNGSYKLGSNPYTAICDLVPGKYTDLGGLYLEKPEYMGLTCKTDKYIGH